MSNHGNSRLKLSWLLPWAFVAVLVVLWELATRRQPGSIVPGPWVVMKGMLELARKGLLFKYVIASLFRVTWGFMLAVLTAIPIGLYAGWYRRAELAINPYMQILRPISPLAWIP